GFAFGADEAAFAEDVAFAIKVNAAETGEQDDDDAGVDDGWADALAQAGVGEEAIAIAVGAGEAAAQDAFDVVRAVGYFDIRAVASDGEVVAAAGEIAF